MSLQGRKQSFKTDDIRIVPESSLFSGNGEKETEEAKAQRRLRAAFLEVVDKACTAPQALPWSIRRLPAVDVEEVVQQSSVPDLFSTPPPEDRLFSRSWEIAAALDAALPEDDRPTGFYFSARDIAAALDAALPEEPRKRKPAAMPVRMFEIAYDTELKHLVKDQLVDPSWLPSGLFRSPARPARN